MRVAELPSTWQRALVRDVVNPDRRITYGVVQPGPRQSSDTGVPLIRGQDYNNGSVQLVGLYYVLPSIARSYQRSVVRGGDVLLSIVGVYVGTVGEVPSALQGANITQTTARIAVRGENCPRFFFHSLQGFDFQREVRRFTKGSAQPGLNLADVEVMAVVVPPAAEQRQIAAILDTIDDAIQKTEQIIAKLKQVKHGLLHDLLTRGIDDNDELRDPERHPEQFKDSLLGRIPREWEVRSLDACVHPQAPITYGIVQAGPHIPDGIPYIRTGDMSGDRLALDGLLRTSARVAASYARSRVESDEIVCAIRATVGKVLPVPRELDGANLTQGTARIAPEPDMNPGFLLWALRGHGVQRQFDLSVKGTTFREITLAQLRLLLVPVPLRRQEQDRIALFMQRAVEREDSEIAERDKLRLMKAGLMEDLLTGRVRVTKLLENAAP